VWGRRGGVQQRGVEESGRHPAARRGGVGAASGGEAWRSWGGIQRRGEEESGQRPEARQESGRRPAARQEWLPALGNPSRLAPLLSRAGRERKISSVEGLTFSFFYAVALVVNSLYTSGSLVYRFGFKLEAAGSSGK
jgi:hypothetical protein